MIFIFAIFFPPDRFAHIINVDFFEDLLKVLGNLQRSGDLKRRQSILCIATVLAVLDGQGQALTLDPTAFHKNLYSILIQLKCGKAVNKYSPV
jgi:nucleolar complex protein 3